jgi:membrane fusion protein (multidrug efflux system)
VLLGKRKIVKPGVTYNGQAEILSGLTGDALVTDGAADIEDGDKDKVLVPGN